MAPPDKMQRLSYAVAGDMYERLCDDDGYVYTNARLAILRTLVPPSVTFRFSGPSRGGHHAKRCDVATDHTWRRSHGLARPTTLVRSWPNPADFGDTASRQLSEVQLS